MQRPSWYLTDIKHLNVVVIAMEFTDVDENAFIQHQNNKGHQMVQSGC